jgi:hypothetical protein
MIVNALIAVLGLLAVALVVAAFAVLRDPKATRRRVETIFRRPEKPRPLAADHYYKHYWS